MMRRSFFLRFRIFLLAAAIGLAVVQFSRFLDDRRTDAELESATIVTPVLAPKFRQTRIWTMADRTHRYEYTTNKGETLIEWSCSDNEMSGGRSGRVIDKFTAYEIVDHGASKYLIVDRGARRCIESPTAELGIEFLSAASPER